MRGFSRHKAVICGSTMTQHSAPQSEVDEGTAQEHSGESRLGDNRVSSRYTEDEDSIYHDSDHEDEDDKEETADDSEPLSRPNSSAPTTSGDEHDGEPDEDISVDEEEWHPSGQSRVDPVELTKELIRRFSEYLEYSHIVTDTHSMSHG